MPDRDRLIRRAQGTAWRLGLAACLVCALPSLATGIGALYAFGVAIYYFVLILLAMLTVFTLFASEAFRNLFSAVSADSLESFGVSATQTLLPYIPYVAAMGLLLCAVAVGLGIKRRGLPRAKSGIVAAGVVAVLTVVAVILVYVFAAKTGQGGAV